MWRLHSASFLLRTNPIYPEYFSISIKNITHNTKPIKSNVSHIWIHMVLEETWNCHCNIMTRLRFHKPQIKWTCISYISAQTANTQHHQKFHAVLLTHSRFAWEKKWSYQFQQQQMVSQKSYVNSFKMWTTEHMDGLNQWIALYQLLWLCGTGNNGEDGEMYRRGITKIPERLASVQLCWPQIPHGLTGNFTGI